MEHVVEEGVVVELSLDEERRNVLMILPQLPLVEWEGKAVTGVALPVEKARELAMQLIRWSVIAEGAQDAD